MSRNHLSVYKDGRVAHYSIDAEGDVVVGIHGMITWDGDLPGAGWEKLIRPQAGYRSDAAARAIFDLTKAVLS